MIKKHLSLLLLWLMIGSAYAQRLTVETDSLIKALPTAKNDSQKVDILYRIAYNYQDINPAEGIKYGNKALELAKDMRWERGKATAYGVIGINYKFKSDYPNALDNYFKALQINEEQGNRKGMAANLGNIGTVYNEQADYGKALTYYRKSLAIDEALNQRYGISTTLGNISTVFASQYIFDSALLYYNRALKMDEEDGNKEGIVKNLANIATMYNDQKKYEEALDYYNRALDIARALGDKNMLAVLYGNMGQVYLNVAVDSTGTMKTGKWVSPGKASNAKQAVVLLNKAIELCKSIQYLEALNEFSRMLSQAQELLGNYKDALDNYKQYVLIKDSVFSTDNKVALANLATQREESLKEKQIEINKLAGKEKQNERLFFISGIALLLLAIAFVNRSYAAQKRTNRLLQTEKEKSDGLAASLAESLAQKEILMGQLALSADMKSRFFANISHELRTPVTLLTGMLELMKEGNSKDSKEKMEVAYGNSVKLKNMVEEILDLSKLEHNEGKLKTEVKLVAPSLKRAVYAFESLIHKEQLTLRYEEGKIGAAYIMMDESRFEKIINNLIYNAIKFNQKGGWIKVECHLGADGQNIVISVANSGMGIDGKDLPHIFERFYQGSSNKLNAEGAGIGLSLVKEFTLLLGGNVSVQSDQEQGTVFTLQFPVVPHTAADLQQEEELAMPEENWAELGRKQQVLIVEDNKEMRYYLKQILGDEVIVAEAEDGRQALGWLENNKPDLIISDVMMPEMDGREFIRHIKDAEAYKKIPVITLTALADSDNQIGILRMGVDDYIIKPFNAVELRVRAYNLLKNNAERLAYNQQPAEADDIAADSKEAAEFKNRLTEFVLARMKNENISVFDLAYEMAMSERQLYRLAKNLTGCTPAQLIKEVRLQKAYELLQSGNISKVDDVAKRVGFENTGYFARQFLERFGKKATEFI